MKKQHMSPTVKVKSKLSLLTGKKLKKRTN